MLASHGSIIIFNVCEIRSDAFLITDNDIRYLPLPLLKFNDLVAKAALFRQVTKTVKLSTYAESRTQLSTILESIEAITRDWSINFKLQPEGSSPPTYLFDLAECKVAGRNPA
jgi:hypothetical protein